MKFKNLTEEDKVYARNTYLEKSLTWDDRMRKLMDYFDKSERTVRYWLVKLGIKEKEDAIPEAIEIAKQKQHDTGKKRFLITAAQNATKINLGFWQNLLAYAQFIDAEV